MNPNELREAIANALADNIKLMFHPRGINHPAGGLPYIAGWKSVEDAILALISPEETAGWRLVPEEPTEAMVEAACTAGCEWGTPWKNPSWDNDGSEGESRRRTRESFRDAYLASLAAAPKAPGGDDSPARDLGTPAGSGVEELVAEARHLRKLVIGARPERANYPVPIMLERLADALSPPTDPLPNTTGGER